MTKDNCICQQGENHIPKHGGKRNVNTTSIFDNKLHTVKYYHYAACLSTVWPIISIFIFLQRMVLYAIFHLSYGGPENVSTSSCFLHEIIKVWNTWPLLRARSRINDIRGTFYPIRIMCQNMQNVIAETCRMIILVIVNVYQSNLLYMFTCSLFCESLNDMHTHLMSLSDRHSK